MFEFDSIDLKSKLTIRIKMIGPF